MPLQIRRGPTADRLAIIPLEGELVYDTESGVVYIGDGTTPGGNPASEFTVEDARLATARTFLGDLLSDNTVHNGISFQYINDRLIATVGVDLSGDLRGSLFSDDSTRLVDGTAGTFNLDGTVGTHVIPNADVTYDLGSSSNRFRDLYLSGSSIKLGDATITATGTAVNLPAGSTVNGIPLEDPKNSIFGDDSTLLVDGVDSKINLDGTVKGDVVPDISETYDLGSFTKKFSKLYLTESNASLWLGNAAIGSVGTAINLPVGSTIGGDPIGRGDGVVEGSNYKINIVGDDSTLIVDTSSKQVTAAGGFVGNLTGTVVGELVGSVFADNSTLLVDGINSSLHGTLFTTTINSSDGNPITVNPTANLLNGANLTGELNITGRQSIRSTTLGVANLALEFAADSDNTTDLLLRKSRGDFTTPAAVQNGDRLFNINFSGWDGSSYVSAATIQSRVAGAVSTGVVPTQLRFFVTSATGQLFEPMTIQPTGDVWLFGSSANSSPIQMFTAHDSSTTGSNLLMIRSRGTNAAPTALQNGDPVFDMAFAGYDGAANRAVAQIRATVDGAVSSGIVPGKIEFQATDSSGASATRVSISSTNATFNVMPILPTFADQTAAVAAVGTPVNGMMYYDTALTKIRAYANGVWVDLH